MLGYLLYQILLAPTVKMGKNVVEKITDMTENELYGEDKIKTEIIKLQMMLEMDEITEKQYDEAEDILMKRLEESTKRREGEE
jgi:hypothetical protein